MARINKKVKIGNSETTIEDLIPEVITNENGVAVKFPEGTMFCHKHTSGTASFDAQWYMFWIAYFDLGDYPVPFIETPRTSIQYTGLNTQWIGSQSNRTGSHVGTIGILKPNNAKDVNMFFDVIAIGRWKK